MNLPRGTQIHSNEDSKNMVGNQKTEYNIGTINISSDADGERWLAKLTRNQEITARGMTPS